LASIKESNSVESPYNKVINLVLRGSAGQSFGVFQTKGVNIRLIGEANDSVCKSMSGGKTVIVPPENVKYKPEDNAIIGNCALYGATNGKFYVYGQAGDRFAVRNSGATAVVEGTGLHACEYMTNGTVVILGHTSDNVGAGMTGGELFLYEDPKTRVNTDYIVKAEISKSDNEKLRKIIEDYFEETNSSKAGYILSDWEKVSGNFSKFIPHSMVEKHSVSKTEPAK
jgi:glutamate synthase domain-containing protein 3